VASEKKRPVRIAIADDYEIVVAGIAAALAPYSERVEVVELDTRVPTISDVDIVLHDTFGRPQGDAFDLALLASPNSPKVVVFSWNLQPHLVDRALDQGAAGYLAKSLTAEKIVTALERVHAGECVRALGLDIDEDISAATWPTRDHGLSEREAEVLALISQGLTNQEIAERCYLSINSIKTYIRTAYRKIGVSRRAQAVGWGLENGLDPDHSRIIRPEGTGLVTHPPR
jgi:NarL family two-component system response regulator LiaR